MELGSSAVIALPVAVYPTERVRLPKLAGGRTHTHTVVHTGRSLMANSTQGLAILMFLAAFASLGLSFFYDGNLLFVLLFLVALGASAALFLKAKALTP
jgi:hypothetical protein